MKLSREIRHKLAEFIARSEGFGKNAAYYRQLPDFDLMRRASEHRDAKLAVLALNTDSDFWLTRYGAYVRLDKGENCEQR